jgi:hypothetical protein
MIPGKKAMALQKIMIFVTVLLIIGCAEINEFTKLDNFDATSRAYAFAIRWSDFNEAEIYIKPSTDYVIKKTAVSEDQNQVIQIVEVTYYRNDRMVVKSIPEKELWEWDEEAQKWELSSGLPDFK